MFKRFAKTEEKKKEGTNTYKAKRKYQVQDAIDNVPMAAEVADVEEKSHVQRFDLSESMTGDTIRPIIFTPAGICGNAQPFLRPVLKFEHFNETLNTETALKDMDRFDVCDLNTINRNIIRMQIKNYIIQQCFLSFCGYIDSQTAVNSLDILKYSNIREKCFNYLNMSEAIHNVTSILFEFGSPLNTENFENRPESLYHYCGIVSKQLAHAVHSIYCQVIEESVNELILMNPNRLETQYAINTCVSYSEELRKMRAENPENIPTVTSIWLKTLLTDKIDALMSVVSIGINDVIVYSGTSNFFVFTDYLKSMGDDNQCVSPF